MRYALYANFSPILAATVDSGPRQFRQGKRGRNRMTPQTETATRALWAADPTIPRERAEAAIRLAKGEESQPLPRIVRTKEAARLFHVTTKTLRAWAKAGALVPVYGKNKLRIGYTEASVRALAEA